MIRIIDFETTIAGMITEGVAAAGLLAGIISLLMNWRLRILRARDRRAMLSFREEMERGQQQCLGHITEVREILAEAEKNAQANLELLRDGRLGMPARARALRMLRSGMAAETTAIELGLARNEVQLLEKVAVLLAPRN